MEMEISGRNFIAGALSAEGKTLYRAANPATQEDLAPGFHEATSAEIDRALTSAAHAHERYRRQAPDKIAAFLDRIAEEILGLGDDLIRRAESETALPAARLTGERGRTVFQLKM